MNILKESYTMTPYLLGILIPLLICVVLWHAAVTSKRKERNTAIVYGLISAMCLMTAVNMSTHSVYTHKATVRVHDFREVSQLNFRVVEKVGDKEYVVVRKLNERPGAGTYSSQPQ